MSLTKFELQDIWHILQPQAKKKKKTNKLLERIAIALERGNSLEHILSDSEKKLLCTCKDKKERKKK